MVELRVLTDYDFFGGERNVRRLVDSFYAHMDKLPEAKKVRDMHAADLSGAREKLYLFLTGWLGGPPLYEDKFGHPQLRMRHLPFKIGPEDRDQWMLCMTRAMEEIDDVSEELRSRLLIAFSQIADHMMNQPPKL